MSVCRMCGLVLSLEFPTTSVYQCSVLKQMQRDDCVRPLQWLLSLGQRKLRLIGYVSSANVIAGKKDL